MDYFIYILTNIMLPIFLVILAGAVLSRRANLDVKNMTKLQMNLLIPVMLFTKIYDSDLEASLVLMVTIITSLAIGVSYVLSFVLSKILRFTKQETSVFMNTASFFNSGNFSLPLMNLLYSNPLAVSIQAIIMLVQSILLFTTGVYVAGAGRRSSLDTLKYIFKMPLIYAIVTAFVLKNLNINIYHPVKESLNLIALGYSSIAIITLGAQLGKIQIRFSNYKIFLSNFIRLIVGPLIALIFVMLFGISGLAAQVLIIALGAPTAVNVVLTSIELDNEPEFASQAVFSSTLLASITMSFVIFMVFKYIPV